MKSLKKQIYVLVTDWFVWFYFIISSYQIVYLNLILNSRYLEFSWENFWKIVFIGMGLSLVFRFIPNFSIGKHLFLKSSKTETSFFKLPCGCFLILILILTFLTGLVVSQFSMKELLSAQGIEGAKRIFTSLFNPNFQILEPTIFAAVETIYMAFIATCFAIPVAFVLSFMAAQNVMKNSLFLSIIYNGIRFFMNLSRSIEPLVWAIIFSVWVGIGPFAGMLALFLHSVSSLTKLYSEQIEVVDEGPIEAMIATGARPIQVLWFGIVPQVILPFLSYTIYRWDINVRMATVIGLVGGGGIGTMLMQYQGLAKWNEVGLIVLVIAVIVWLMDFLSAKIRLAIK